MNKQKLFIWLLAAAVPVVALLPLPDFWIAQLNYIGLYALVCLGLVLLTGVGGLTSFGQAAFVGVGAYTLSHFEHGHVALAHRLCRVGHHGRQCTGGGRHHAAHVRPLPAFGHHRLGLVFVLPDGQPPCLGQVRRLVGSQEFVDRQS